MFSTPLLPLSHNGLMKKRKAKNLVKITYNLLAIDTSKPKLKSATQVFDTLTVFILEDGQVVQMTLTLVVKVI